MGQLSQEGLTISFRAFLHQCPHYFCIATNYSLVFLFPTSLMFAPSHIFPNQRFSNIICQMNEWMNAQASYPTIGRTICYLPYINW